MRAERQAGEEAEQEGAAEVDRQGAERERPADPLGHGPVDQKARHRADAAEEQDAAPDRHGHRRTLTRRITAVAT